MLQNSGSAPKPDATGSTCGERRLLPPSSYRTTGARCGLGLIQPLSALPASHSSGTDVRLQSENGGCFPCLRSDRCYPRGAAEWPASRRKKSQCPPRPCSIPYALNFHANLSFFSSCGQPIRGLSAWQCRGSHRLACSPRGKQACQMRRIEPVAARTQKRGIPFAAVGHLRCGSQPRAASRASGECAQQSVRTTPPVLSANDAATLTFVLTHPACLSPLNRGRTTKLGGFRKDTRQ